MWLINVYVDDFTKRKTLPTFSLATGNLLINGAEPDKMGYKCLTLNHVKSMLLIIYLYGYYTNKPCLFCTTCIILFVIQHIF